MTTPTYESIPNWANDEIKSVKVVVAVGGTAESASAASIPSGEIVVQAMPGNSGLIYVGGQDIANDMTRGYALAAKDNWIVTAFNLENILIHGAQAGDGVVIQYRG